MTKSDDWPDAPQCIYHIAEIRIGIENSFNSQAPRDGAAVEDAAAISKTLRVLEDPGVLEDAPIDLHSLVHVHNQ